MKGKLLIILSGVALLHLFLLGGLALTGGCSSDGDEAASDKYYVPAPAQESSVPATSSQSPAIVESAPALTGPSSSVEMTTLPPISTSKAEAIKYSVQKGDSLWKIAKMYGVGVDELASYNQISAAKGLKVGQSLMIPPGGRLLDKGESVKASAAKKETAKSSSSKTSVKSTAASAPKKADASPAPASADGSYTVQKGDSFAKIAAKHHVKLADLVAANNADVNKMLQVGQKLVIPKPGAKVATAPKDDAKVSATTYAKKDGEAEKTAAPVAPKTPGESLLDEIPSPDTPPVTDAKPLATDGLVSSVAKDAAPTVATPVLSAETIEIDQDSTVDAIAAKFGCKADEIKKLNPELPADGKLKTGMVVKLP